MSRRTLGTTVAAVGLLVALLFVLGDVIGVGKSPGFGIGQISGTIIGAVLIIVGGVIWRSAT